MELPRVSIENRQARYRRRDRLSFSHIAIAIAISSYVYRAPALCHHTAFTVSARAQTPGPTKGLPRSPHSGSRNNWELK